MCGPSSVCRGGELIILGHQTQSELCLRFPKSGLPGVGEGFCRASVAPPLLRDTPLAEHALNAGASSVLSALPELWSVRRSLLGAQARAPAAGRCGPPIRPQPQKSQAGHTRVNGAARLPPTYGDRAGRRHGGPTSSGQPALTLQRRLRPGRLLAILLPVNGLESPYRYGGLRISLERVRGPPARPTQLGPTRPTRLQAAAPEPRPVTGTPGRAHTGRRPVFFSQRGQGKSESREARAQ
ncbi:hypothetical protein NDU88_001602 [Pleurodeles waltl]|uniref:Uncharacterized protein n=1 Tax=Pleurodeles waltl TaxID=8319 RepID=A0AAV7WL13_PLEWA|nr:hypothetical protein NDU88_001602 [Pleurodeles waltl]